MLLVDAVGAIAFAYLYLRHAHFVVHMHSLILKKLKCYSDSLVLNLTSASKAKVVRTVRQSRVLPFASVYAHR